MNKKALFARLAAFSAAALTIASAHAVDPADALAALGTLQTTNAGMGPPLFGLAVVAVGILIGVKWIKRGRGAA